MCDGLNGLVDAALESNTRLKAKLAVAEGAIAEQDRQIKRLRAEQDALIACRHGEQRCHECPDTKCGDNMTNRSIPGRSGRIPVVWSEAEGRWVDKAAGAAGGEDVD